MITLYFNINNISSVISLYDQIQVIRFVGSAGNLGMPVGDVPQLSDWVEVFGVAPNTAPINLNPIDKVYYVYDDQGSSFDWYSSRYINSTDPTINSGWATPVLGDGTALYMNPLYPSEVVLTNQENRVVDRIRILIGDPYGLVREAGEEALSNFHPGGTVYQLQEKGWPIAINMAGVQYTEVDNPTVNGYRYLKFNSDVSSPTTVSGVTYGIDVWYYTFRHSDKEILDAYDNIPPPDGLTETTASTEAYILNTAIDLLRSEILLDATEDGGIIGEDRGLYNPGPGLSARQKILDDLQKKLDKLVKSLVLSGITGVLID